MLGLSALLSLCCSAHIVNTEAKHTASEMGPCSTSPLLSTLINISFTSPSFPDKRQVSLFFLQSLMPSLSFDHTKQSNPLRTLIILQHAPCGFCTAATGTLQSSPPVKRQLKCHTLTSNKFCETLTPCEAELIGKFNTKMSVMSETSDRRTAT